MTSGIKPMLTCREFADFMADYLADELSPAIKDSFDEHLRLCPNCRRYLASYKETVALGRHAFEDYEAMLPPEVPDDLVKAILAVRPRP